MTSRGLDLVGALLAALFLWPLAVFAAIAVAVESRGGVLFRARRMGRAGRPFTMLKFRTMTEKLDANGTLLPDAERLTSLGRFLRSTSLDELPGLWSVLKGDMSLVGPRPLLMEYLPLYSNEQARRHDVRPGITGWAQVNGRNSLSWQEKFKLDVWYVENQSFFLDLKILLMTISRVIKKTDIAHEGQATMEKFRGNDL